MAHAILQFSGGLAESAGQVVAAVGALVLVLMLVALGGFAYKSLQGNGIEWPDDREPDSGDEEVQHGNDDDEWKYY